MLKRQLSMSFEKWQTEASRMKHERLMLQHAAMKMIKRQIMFVTLFQIPLSWLPPERAPFFSINPIQHRLRKTRSSPGFVLCLLTISAGEAN